MGGRSAPCRPGEPAALRRHWSAPPGPAPQCGSDGGQLTCAGHVTCRCSGPGGRAERVPAAMGLLQAAFSLGVLLALSPREGLCAPPAAAREAWGYVHARPGAHMFWWLYYADSPAGRPEQLPLVMWLQGGPGGSGSGFGNFEEIGPLNRDLQPRKTNWVQAASVLFVDNPVGTGFSYSERPDGFATDVATVAADMLVVLRDFFTERAEFQDRDDNDGVRQTGRLQPHLNRSGGLSPMEGQLFPDHEQLLQFLRRLKEVFDVCDEDADGFIRVEHLLDLGLQFGQGEEVKKLTRHLYPNAHGKISFKDFCHAVFAIKGCEEILKMTVGAPSHASHHQSVTDNGYIYQSGETKLGPPIIMCTQPFPESGVFNQGCRAAADQGKNNTTHNPNNSETLDTSPPDCSSHLMGSASASVISGEEQFEDYGERVDVDFTPSSPCPEDDSHTNGFSDLGSSLPSRPNLQCLSRPKQQHSPRFIFSLGTVTLSCTHKGQSGTLPHGVKHNGLQRLYRDK
ncbi:unnamed protein product [Menidia menidia]|uniref:(Atlantic silverside) hypothetical protein n=1 Tax=Menidia menidia TaxID=238744 RepID=A0A8S4AZA8_9TELE|nr:unnamed protein product [Menidia menidia]